MISRYELVRQLAPDILLAMLPIDVVEIVVGYAYDLRFGVHACRYFLSVD